MHNTFEWASGAVARSAIYIDTVKVYVDRTIEDTEKIWLIERCGSLRSVGALRHQEARWRDGLVLHQPQPQALEYIAGGFDAHVLSRVDIALDLITETRTDALELQDYLERRLVQRWRRRDQPVVKKKGTIYYRRAGGRNNLVMYSDRPSKKVAGHPCVHIEFRMECASAIKASGIARIEDLGTVDLVGQMKKRFSLRDLPTYEELTKLGRALHGAGKSRPRLLYSFGNGLVIDRYPMKATVWLGATQGITRDMGWAVQDVLDSYGQHWSRYFRPLPTDWMFYGCEAL